ncbi:MAG: A/G-specific adenine glycosylase [Candidatus Azotimanducaceae bacterium]|jgi:A/G-specific adenine glycosylase
MNQKQKKFVDTVWEHYNTHGRHKLLWRKTSNPYKILVSEIMCQQTQVERVFPKYTLFLKTFPKVSDLAQASLGEVLELWQGLGYNRRAKMLHNCAKNIVGKYNGKFPKTYEELKALPGIGPYTAGAIMAFAYNKAVPIIETNIRTVYLHHFFKNKTDVNDKEILQSIGVTMDQENPREWYWALMDYGSYLKKTHGNPNSRSKHYAKQSKFEGSDRQIRGAILRVFTSGKLSLTRLQLHKTLNTFEDIRIDAQTEKLLKEGLLHRTKQKYHLPY